MWRVALAPTTLPCPRVIPVWSTAPISGFGQDGPWRDRPGHDINYLALSGYLDVEAAVGGKPWPPPVLISDLTSGLYTAIAVLAAVCGRQVSGSGAYVDLSMAEAAVSFLGLEIGRATAEGASYGQPNVDSLVTRPV